jgi:mono/diheme cytochrome c family protein
MVLIVMLCRIFNRTVIKALILMCPAFLLGSALAQPTDSGISRGAYLARVGDCVACHTAGPQSPPFAGGLPLNSPFGVIYSSNITPDPVNGIGRYTLSAFIRAVREGVDNDGNRLYPAMPYPSFAKMTDEDIRAL